MSRLHPMPRICLALALLAACGQPLPTADDFDPPDVVVSTDDRGCVLTQDALLS